MIDLVLTRERIAKTLMIMTALEAGSGGEARMVMETEASGGEFIVWGHRWTAERIVPAAIKHRVPWWLVDNGYYLPARGTRVGYYALTLNGVAPAVLADCDPDRLKINFQDWTDRPRGVVIVSPPTEYFGAMMGFKRDPWLKGTLQRLGKATDRQVEIRQKGDPEPLDAALRRAYCVVTHSSKIAIDAVKAGVPCIVAPSNPAAPVCATSIDEIERLPRPDRAAWWSSLMAQQWTLAEMRSGLAWQGMEAIRAAWAN